MSEDEDNKKFEEEIKPDKRIDSLLQTFVTGIDGTELEMPITLLVGGIFISGNIISAHKYLQYVNEIVFPPTDEGDKFVDDSAIQNLIDKAKIRKEKGVEIDRKIRIIHLGNAKFFHPSGNPIPSNQINVIWRGKLSSVDGWFYGTLNSNE